MGNTKPYHAVGLMVCSMPPKSNPVRTLEAGPFHRHVMRELLKDARSHASYQMIKEQKLRV